jgi:peptidoglycan hydrolase-like protein with peptidoglycan-binding domain
VTNQAPAGAVVATSDGPCSTAVQCVLTARRARARLRPFTVEEGGSQMSLGWPFEQEGSIGEDVRSVQYFVTAQGHPTGVDGVFGPLTKAAVEAFQSSRGSASTGSSVNRLGRS